MSEMVFVNRKLNLCGARVHSALFWEPRYTTLDLRSHVALLGTQLMAYSPTHHSSFGFLLLPVYDCMC